MSRNISRISVCITPELTTLSGASPRRLTAQWLAVPASPMYPASKKPCCVTVLDTTLYCSVARPYVSFLSGHGDLSTCYAYLCVVEPSPKTWQMLICSTADEPGSEFHRPVCNLVRNRRPVRERKKNFCAAERYMALASVRKQCEYRSDTLGVEVRGLQKTIRKSNHKIRRLEEHTGLLSMLLRRCLPFLICVLRAAESRGFSSSKLHRSSVETAMTAPQLSNSPQYY